MRAAKSDGGSFLLRVCQRLEIDLDTRSQIPCPSAGSSSRSVSLHNDVSTAVALSETILACRDVGVCMGTESFEEVEGQ